MKVILSRKGFDSTSGRCPNPIMPDGTLLSLPIPEATGLTYSDIAYNNQTYKQILKQLNPREEYRECHLDPDIRPNVRVKSLENWVPAFGQTGAAQSYLSNCGVCTGDIFLFFGRFRQTKIDINKVLRYKKGSQIRHIIFGYLQVGKIISEREEIQKYYWHPHAIDYMQNPRNTIYLPTEKLSIKSSKPGYGTFHYNENLVLTMPNESTSTWKEKSFYMPESIYGNRRNSSKGNGISYRGRWQELVLYENDATIDWVKSLIP